MHGNCLKPIGYEYTDLYSLMSYQAIIHLVKEQHAEQFSALLPFIRNGSNLVI